MKTAPLALIAALAAAPALAQESAEREMEFEDCLALIEKVTAEYGAPPTEVVNTEEQRTVRFPVTDGTVLMTCSRPDRKMTLRKDG